jgi:methionyl-tRNA formyltransferase
MTSAVVFAYHEVGCRCLAVVLAHGIRVPLVVTHEDAAEENIWFGSVAALARAHGIEVATPENPNAPECAARIRAIAPDFLFSFYYRKMLSPALLSLASRGAYNMHGSLLPKYRGRVPVNWAVLHGERQTGATLHQMTAKPDAGGIVDRQAVPILPNDTAGEVFAKVTDAAEMVLDRALPHLLDGTAVATPQDLAAGSYFGARRPEDGRIDWTRPAAEIHNLVRAVSPPYPGAFSHVDGTPLRVLRTLLTGRRDGAVGAALFVEGDRLPLRCADGGVLLVLAAELGDAPVTAESFRRRFGTDRISLHN